MNDAKCDAVPGRQVEDISGGIKSEYDQTLGEVCQLCTLVSLADSQVKKPVSATGLSPQFCDCPKSGPAFPIQCSSLLNSRCQRPTKPRQIPAASILLNGSIPVESVNADGHSLIAKFDRDLLIDYLRGFSGEVEFHLRAEIPGEAILSGADTVRIAPGENSHEKQRGSLVAGP